MRWLRERRERVDRLTPNSLDPLRAPAISTSFRHRAILRRLLYRLRVIRLYLRTFVDTLGYTEPSSRDSVVAVDIPFSTFLFLPFMPITGKFFQEEEEAVANSPIAMGRYLYNYILRSMRPFDSVFGERRLSITYFRRRKIEKG